uniref:Tr-type G domain-containing protein n=1 Tax=Homalodisca liturata TaxID=320908 RepID=A0A1B6IM34_9HEMI
MSRHRNVRSINYSDEYDGYDDVYGHSVEDDHCISPSDAAFMYDRSSRQTQISAFITEEDDIAEEDENEEHLERRDSDSFKYPELSDVDEARLRSCLDEIHSVIGDSIPENIVVETIIQKNFDIALALDSLLNSPNRKKEEEPKPQRIRRPRGLEKEHSNVVGTKADTSSTSCDGPPTISVVAPAKTSSVVKGFQVSKSDTSGEGGLKPGDGTPRSQSPSFGKTTPEGSSPEVQRKLKNSVNPELDNKTPAKNVLAEDEWKKVRGDGKEHLHMVTIGHVDAGKSTLMGHLLYRLGRVNQKLMHKYEQESKKLGKQSFMYAWILDETGEERNRGITMDVGQSQLETETKIVTLLDAPGHKDFIPNMITGAAQADVALLVVDATRGEFETGFESGGQTREHALLVRSLGVSQLCVAINKLDTVGWSEKRFLEIASKLKQFLLKQAGYQERDVTFVPCSGLTGENLIGPPTEQELKQWYTGPYLLQVIDKFKVPERPVSKPLRISVNDVFKGTGSGFCIAGRVETGMVQAGDKVLVQPQNVTASVKAITIEEVSTQSAFAGDSVSVTIAGYDQQNMAVGYVLCDPQYPVPVTTRFEARIVLFNITVPITKGFSVILHQQSLVEPAVITKLLAQLHKSSGEVVKRRPRCLTRNTSALVVLETSRPICVELYQDVKELGRFMLRVGGATIAAGLITKVL